MRVELKNYRAFSDQAPAVWDFEDGFTAFVGLNNSGKSSLLRFFHEIRPSLQRVTSQMGSFLAGTASPRDIDFLSVADNHEVFHNGNDRPMTARFELVDPDSEPEAVTLTWSRSLELQVTVEWRNNTAEIRSTQEWPMIAVESGGYLGNLNTERYMAAFNDYLHSIYLGPFRNAVNVGGQSSYYDLQIGEQFIAEWDGLKTGNNRTQNRAAVSVQNELRQIFGLDRLEINAAPGNSTLQVIANDEPYQLQEQGAGFAQFMVVLAFVATRNPAYIFIDEPELNLHPSLQLDYLTTLAKYSQRGVAFATHSIGLARSVGQRIYSVHRTADERREVRALQATKNYGEFLGELSYSGYSDLGFDRVLLVEGPTEVPVFQYLLRFHQIEHKVVMVPLGGGSLINAHSIQALGEISRVTSNVSVLIDSERESEDDPLAEDRQAFVDECTKLGFDVHVLERRALENYLTDAAIKKVKGEKYRALAPFESRSGLDPVWGKNENWQIASAINPEDLAETDLGEFLERLTAAVSS